MKWTSNPRNCLAMLLLPAMACAQTQAVATRELSAASTSDTLHILVGHSTVLHTTHVIRRIYLGTPAVVQSYTAGPQEIVLTAKSAGLSSLVLWDASGQSRLYNVIADVDSDALRLAVHDAYPATPISVEGHEGRLYLTGDVPAQEIADGATRLASTYTKDIVNALRVVPPHPRQVQLKLRIVEMDRTKMEQYGFNLAGLGKSPFNVTTGQFPSVAQTTTSSTTGGGSSSTLSVSDMLNVFLYSSRLNLSATVKDLEQKQVLQVLAEPTLTAISGQSAKFLSGGEFPYPVVQGGTGGAATSVTIQFRPYGVKVDFTPTVNADGTIRLKVTPEVSTLDFSNAVTISGFTIPALSTRRAETEVEIRSGESFAVSGLLDHRTTESLSQIPGISRLPLFGKLFITKAYTHSVVELMVIVTATVVDPLAPGQPAPTEPVFLVPNLDTPAFDRDIRREQVLPPVSKP